MGPSNVVFEEFSVRDIKGELAGKRIADCGLAQYSRVSLVAVRYPSGQYELNPLPSTVLQPSWRLVMLGNPEQVRKFKSAALDLKPGKTAE